jgi:hypothetical protein
MFCKAFPAFVLINFLLVLPVYPAILLTEDFESAATGQTPPSGWSTEVLTGSNYLFFFTSGTFPVCTPFSGARLVEFQSFNYSSGENRLKRTQPVSSVGYTNVVIDFAWFTDPGYINSKDKMEVQWSINGTDWTTAATFFRYDSVQQWSVKTVSLPAEASGQATLYFSFLFTANFIFGIVFSDETTYYS